MRAYVFVQTACVSYDLFKRECEKCLSETKSTHTLTGHLTGVSCLSHFSFVDPQLFSALCQIVTSEMMIDLWIACLS